MAEPSFHRRKAEECSRAAAMALQNGLWETAVVRSYYAAYHLVLAIMVHYHEPAPVRGWNHQSVHDRFITRFCRQGLHFSRRDGEELTTLLAARTDADYRDVLFDEKRARRVVERSEALCSKIMRLLDGQN